MPEDAKILKIINYVARNFYGIEEIKKSRDQNFRYEYYHPTEGLLIKFGNPSLKNYITHRNETLRLNWYRYEYYQRLPNGKMRITETYSPAWSTAVFLWDLELKNN